MHRVTSRCFIMVCTAFLSLVAASAGAIPAFARKYKDTCDMCHTVIPELNRFGRDFRDNGFRTPKEVEELAKPVPSHTPAPKDFWSFTPDEVPLAIQAKFHGVLSPKDDIKSDFQLQELQLQSGGTLTPRVSYYLHQHLVENGEPGTLYTGWVRFNNLLGSDWLNVTVGQFELPVTFSPEIERLSSFDYVALGRTLGGNGFTLGDPQLGIQVFGQSASGTKVWAGLVNGSGVAASGMNGHVDNNSFKDVYGRVSQEIGEGTFGGFAYYGRAPVITAAGDTAPDAFVRVGGDILVRKERDPIGLKALVLYGRDADPLGTGEPRSFVAGLVECQWFATDRTVVLLRGETIHQKIPAPDPALPIADEVFRTNTVVVTPGIQFLVRPNVKIGFEYQVHQSHREDQGIAQLHVAF